jgi:asparagine synthetase B (glutamine-hydrolysing)
MTTRVYVASSTKGVTALSEAVAKLVANVKRLPAGPSRLVAETDFEDIARAVGVLEAEVADTLTRAAKKVAARKERSK